MADCRAMRLDVRFAETLAEMCALADASTCRQMWALFKPIAVKKGDVLLREGAVWDYAIFVERGILRMYFSGSDGRESNKNFHRENALIYPLTVAMQTQPSIFEMAAVEQGVVWRMPMGLFRQHLEQMGCWDALCGVLLDRLLTSKLQRERDLLTLDGRRRYRELCEDDPELARRVPLMHLASYLGMTNVSLSRLRKLSHQESSTIVNARRKTSG